MGAARRWLDLTQAVMSNPNGCDVVFFLVLMLVGAGDPWGATNRLFGIGGFLGHSLGNAPILDVLADVAKDMGYLRL